jgi:hypothetical protein
MTSPRLTGVSVTRRAANYVWLTLLVVPFAFLAVVLGLPRARPGPELVPVFFWISIVASVLGVALSRWLPPRLAAERAGPDATAFLRLIVAWALCEGAAVLPLVAFVITGDTRLVGVFALDMLALVLLFPSDARWDSVRPAPPDPGTLEAR